MKAWKIYSYQIPGVREPHPAVVLGHVDRISNKPQVNIRLCTSQRAGRPALPMKFCSTERTGWIGKPCAIATLFTSSRVPD